VRSMTGYGEKRFEAPGLRARISVKTLNHRYFDWSYKGQPLGGLETRLKALAQKELQRGRVEAAIDLDFLDPAGWEVQINEGLLGKILETARKAAGRLGEDVRFSVDNLFRIPQVVELRHKDLSVTERAFLETAFEQTLAAVGKERLREGRETARRLRRHLGAVRRFLKQVETLAGAQPRNLRDKLKRRLKEIATDELQGFELQPPLNIDAELPLGNLDYAVWGQLKELEPTGYGNPQPLLMSRRVRIRDARRVGADGAHLKLTVSDPDAGPRREATWDAIAFRQGDWFGKLPHTVDLVFSLDENTWNGKTRLQLVVEDLRPASHA